MGRLFLPLFFLFAGASLTVEAQRESSFGISGHLGSFLTKVSKADFLKDSYSSYLQAGWSRQSLLAKRTKLGISVIHGNTGSRTYLGTASALLGTVDLQLLGKGWYRINGRIGFGPGWIGKPYDLERNHKNTLIGSHLNAALQLQLLQEVRIGKHWTWLGGLSFLHFSNGTSSLPNLGLNIPAFTTGLAYRTNTGTPSLRPAGADSARKRQYWQAWMTAGAKQHPLVNSPLRLVNGAALEWSRERRANSRYGALLQFFRDGSPRSPFDTVMIKAGGGGIGIAAAAHYTGVIGRLELPLQLGVYLFNRRDANSLYQSLGIRYRLSRHWLAGLHLKTHMGKADYFHAGFGYQW